MRLTDEQMAQFLAQHDLIYEVAPAEWVNGIPLGNGQIGAVVWGDGATLKITLDKYDCWELRERQFPPDVFNWEHFQALISRHDDERARREFRDSLRDPDAPHPTRLPMPRLEVDLATGQFEARLRLHDATASGAIGQGPTEVRWSALVHADRNLLALAVERERGAEALQVRLRTDHLSEEAAGKLKAWGYEPPEEGEKPDGCRWLRQRFPAGGEYVIAWRVTRSQPGRELLTVSIVSHNDAADPLAEALELVRGAGEWDELHAAHAAWWREYWRRSYLAIPDAQLESLFWVETYKLGCSSRPGGLPISLQGVWSPDGQMPPWSGDYHLDSNLQQSYWPVYPANRLELGECLYETFSRCLGRWRRQCREFFGFDGLWSGCAMGPGGERIAGYHGVTFWPGNTAWLAHNYWLHWLYSRDEQFLREHAYPLMRGCLQTYLGLLEEGEDGRLHLPVGYSPEWGEGGTERYGPDPACDLALIRWLAQALLEAAETAGIDEPDAPTWREVLERLADYPQGEDGIHVTAGQPLIHSHRHFSHLMAIHPLGVLNIEQGDEERDLIVRSMRHLIVTGMGQWAGHSMGPAALIAARVGLGNMAWLICQLYADAFVTPNSFHLNGDFRHFGLSRFTNTPMTIEAGFAYAAAIMEMLLQSWGGVIRLFPAMPDRWSDAYFEDLRAEGAFTVSSRLREGRVVFARIVSEAGGRCRLRNPWPGEAAVVRGPSGEMAFTDETVEWATSAGDEFLVYPVNGEPSEDDMTPVVFERCEHEINWYGVKRQPRF